MIKGEYVIGNKSLMEEMRIFSDRCTGCRTCELVCTFHFTGTFGRKAGAIEVHRNEEEGEFLPVIHKNRMHLRKACDLCADEKTPLCVKYCVVGAIEIITR